MIDIIDLSKKAFERLCEMNFERLGGISEERLIFPNKFPSESKNNKITEKELLKYVRVSEQELRFLFVEEFLKSAPKNYFYSIETPTVAKYKFGKSYNEIEPNINGRSASIDLCLFRRINTDYKRVLNIEFKHENSPIASIGKDILKLINDEDSGAFIMLLDNTDSGTLKSSNMSNKGVIDKLHQCFLDFMGNWKGKSDKSIQIILLSLKEKILIHREISQNESLDDIFKFDTYGSITTIAGNKWGKHICNSKIV